MNIRNRIVTFLAAAMLIAPATMVQATTMGGDNIQAGPFSIGGRGVYSIPEDADDGTWSGGAQVRWWWAPAFGLEGSIDYRRHDFGTTEIHSWPVQASLLFNLIPNKPFNLFLLGGAGWYHTTVDPEGPADDTETRFGPHAGAGMQVFLNKWWSIDATYRYIWLEELNSNDGVFESSYDESGHMITAGLNYHFGGE